MKYLCAILAFLVLTLSAQPICTAGTAVAQDCCHRVDCCGAADQEGNDDEGSCKHCNPFQLCGCCAFSVVPPLLCLIRMRTAPGHSSCCWLTRPSRYIEEPVLGFWQPPKIAA